MNVKELKILLTINFDKALSMIESLIKESNVHGFNDYIHLRARYNELEKSNSRGILTRDYYVRELNIIRLSCIGLIDELGIQHSTEEDTSSKLLEESTKPLYAEKVEITQIPRLDLELIHNGGTKRPLGLSRNNKVDENGAVWLNDVIYINQIEWKYRLKIRNNSSFPAYYPEISIPEGAVKLNILEKLSKNISIPPHEEIELRVGFVKRIESKGIEALDYMKNNKFLEAVGDIKLEIYYQSENGSNFNTKFRVVDQKGINER